MPEKILFLTTGKNKIHTDLISTLDNVTSYNLYKMTKHTNPISNFFGLLAAIWEMPSGYDVIICESNYYYPALKKMLFLLPKKTRIINMQTSPLIYNILKKRIPFFYRIPLKFLLRYVDAYISIGKYGIEVLERLGVKKPYSISYPDTKAISEDFWTLKPDLDSHDMAIIVRKDPYSKGLDLAIDVLSLLNMRYPDAKLHVIGEFKTDKRIREKIKSNSNVVLYGWVDELVPLLSRCSIYLHPGNGEPYGMAVLESMAAGLIPFITKETGVSELLVDICPSSVVDSESSTVAKQIEEVFVLSPDERQLFSDSIRGKLRTKITKLQSKNDFVTDFHNMLKES